MDPVGSMPKLLPALDNLAWNIPAILTNEEPVLAVLELKVRSGVNILELGTPSNNLLRKSLEYCSSLSEARVHCGHIRDQPSSVIILVELPSARAWQDFEASAALDLLVATFESNPTCNCLSWKAPGSFQISGTVELLTVHLGTAIEAFASNRSLQFDQAWAAYTSDIAATGNQSVYGNWFKPYCMAIPFSNSPSRRAAVFAAFDAQPATFLGIVSGDSANNDASQMAMTEVVQKFEGSMRRRTLILEPWLEQPQDVYTMHTSPAPIASPMALFEPVKPVFRRHNGMSLSGEDMTWRSNYYAAREAKTPGFPEPRGGYYALGTINQYSCPTYLGSEHVADASLPIIDTLSLAFRAGVLDASDDQAKQLLERFRQLRQDLRALDHCDAFHWARRHGDASVVVFLLGKMCPPIMLVKLVNRAAVWRSRQNRPEDLLGVCGSLLRRSGLSSHIERGLLHEQSFTVSTDALIGLLTVEHLELITLCTPNNPEAKRLLEIHAKRYFDTALVVNVVAGRRSAGRCISSGYADKRSDHAALVSLWSWNSVEAREHWYSQFHVVVQNNYERLGHIVDGVRLVATGGIHSDVLNVKMIW